MWIELIVRPSTTECILPASEAASQRQAAAARNSRRGPNSELSVSLVRIGSALRKDSSGTDPLCGKAGKARHASVCAREHPMQGVGTVLCWITNVACLCLLRL